MGRKGGPGVDNTVPVFQVPVGLPCLRRGRQAVSKKRKFNGNYFDTKIDNKMFENVKKYRNSIFCCLHCCFLAG